MTELTMPAKRYWDDLEKRCIAAYMPELTMPAKRYWDDLEKRCRTAPRYRFTGRTFVLLLSYFEGWHA